MCCSSIPYDQKVCCTPRLLCLPCTGPQLKDSCRTEHQDVSIHAQRESSTATNMAICLLMRLPAEMHLNIIDKLELQDTIVLARTNRYFRSIIPTPTHEELLKAEADDWARNHGLYACSGCVNLRRFEEFADDMKKGKRSRGGVEATERLCLQCGVARGLYTHGKDHVLCQLCTTFTDRTARHAVCESCLPGAKWPRANAVEHSSIREYVSARTARLYCGRTPTDELYGIWHD
jgi:hypothetical protein